HDMPTTELYTLSLHDALPICLLDHNPRTLSKHNSSSLIILPRESRSFGFVLDIIIMIYFDRTEDITLKSGYMLKQGLRKRSWKRDRKSTRLNSSHVKNSYAVF